jgi:diguanylate cyclase
MQRPIRILLIEDDVDDHLIVDDLLSGKAAGGVQLEWVADYAAGLATLLQGGYDVCLVDVRVGSESGVDLLRAAADAGCPTPMIVLTGAGSERADLAAMQAGAAYYLEKSGLTTERLERAIRYAIGHRQRVSAAAEAPPPAEGSAGAPRILLVDDDEDDYILTKDLLADVFGRALQLEWVRSWRAAIDRVAAAQHDIYLVDYRLDERDGLELVRHAVELGARAPFILLTGQGSREIDLEAMRAGATDYLVKSEITAPLLDRAIRYSIERNRAERRLAELAQLDQLTGLANRYLFREHLGRSLARADRYGHAIALLLLDLDRFKTINDMHGHEVGDQLLVAIARRLQQCVRACDLVARLGGDEFVVIVDGFAAPEVVGHCAQRILQVIKEPVELGRWQVHTGASIGIAIYPADAPGLEELVVSADAAMYLAKERGGDRYQFYTAEMRERASRRLELENGLRRALERDEFVLHYQPQVDLRSGRVASMEALIRWQHPRYGLIGPDDFVHIAEASSLIEPLGAWVLREVCRQLKEWQAAGFPEVRIAVNFSARQFRDVDLVRNVLDVLEEHALASCFLEIEITETEILKNPAQVKSLLQDFADLGIAISLDDFGTGCSSLNHLRSFPGASIKIDQSFIKNLCREPHDAAIVRSLIVMAHNIGLKVVAEGVETLEQLEFLRDQDCDMLQGFAIARPMPASAIGPELFACSLLEELETGAATTRAAG